MPIVERGLRRRRCVAGLAVLFWLTIATVASAQTTVVRPAEIDDILVNPGMGIETFQRFNGQPINDGVRWSEVGPEKAAADERRPSTFRARAWRTCAGSGRRSSRNAAPIAGRLSTTRWQKRIGTASGWRSGSCRTTTSTRCPTGTSSRERSGPMRPTDKDGAIWSPDADDPLYAKYWTALIVEAGKRYDGHPDLNHVDVSTVGYWGEGWGPYLPSWQIQQQLIDVYFTAFPRTPLLMNFDALPALQYGVKRGAGWRLDCWGDMGAPGRSFAHMKDFYPQQLARGGLQEAWRTHPVALETCWVPEQWYQWKFPLKPILDQALRWHASTINIKSSRIPAEWRPAFDEFQKQIGYRFVLKRLEYPSHVTRGAMAPISDVVVQCRRRAGLPAATRSRSRSATRSCRSTPTSRSGCRAMRWSNTRSRCRASWRRAAIRCASPCSIR